MDSRLNSIIHYITSIDKVEILAPFNYDNKIIKGSISTSFSGCNLQFEVEIHPQYPFQIQGAEAIRFINKSLIEYAHVMADGHICIHTFHSPDLKRKLEFDFHSLEVWISKYYLNKKNDEHYEHIIVPEKAINGITSIFLFTDVYYQFTKGEYGIFKYSSISEGVMKKEKTITHIIQDFKTDGTDKEIKTDWANYYKNFPLGAGIFHFIEEPPVLNQRFAIENWTDLQPFCTQKFLLYLFWLNEQYSEDKPAELPLLIGYKINEIEIHWQAILIDMKRFPCYAPPSVGLSRRVGAFFNQEIQWARTRNCSYKYYFGRGKLNNKLSKSKILIIGLGAIGSMVATTLTRGGCKNITLIDYDIKEPENVCRSEYLFSTGITDKIKDLAITLHNISPFVEVQYSYELTDCLKYFANETDSKAKVEKNFEDFDIVFDCSTDNDLAYLLNQIKINGELFNISITNHAKELVCVVSPNNYEWLIKIFETLNRNDHDLYEPTGCWNPTFKASYNDIASLVQFVIKHINLCFENGTPIRNFYLSNSFDDAYNIKLKQF